MDLGIPQSAVIKAIGKPESKGKSVLREATGLHVGEWRYPKQALTLNMSSETPKGAKSVESISAEAPCAFATDLGIKIGSTEDEVGKPSEKSRNLLLSLLRP